MDYFSVISSHSQFFAKAPVPYVGQESAYLLSCSSESPVGPNEQRINNKSQVDLWVTVASFNYIRSGVPVFAFLLFQLSKVNARLKAELHDQNEMNKNLIQRNTDIVLDTSAKDQQIAVLKEQRKCLTQQNTKLKNFLQKADAHLESFRSQQYILQQRQK